MTALVAFWQIAQPLQGATFTWNQTGAGTFTWTTAANWTGGVPANASGDIVNLTADLTAAETITLNSNAVLGTLAIGDPLTSFLGYTLQSSGGSTLTFNNGATAAAINKAAAATASDVIATDIVLAGSNANLNITNLNASTTTGLLTLSGNISESGGAHNLVVAGVAGGSNGVTVLSGTNSFTGSVSLGSGTLRIMGAQALNTTAANSLLLSGGTLELRADGNGTDSGSDAVSGVSGINTQRITFGDNATVSGNTTITVDRLANYTAATSSAAGSLFQTPANKTIELGTLSIGGQTLSVNNSNAYGLEFTGAATMTGSSVFSVANASAVDAIPGLTFSGVLSGAFSPNKIGNGTMLLTNSGNTFTGNINISNAAATAGGVFAVTNDGALGNAANKVNIGSGVSTASSTFAALDSFTLGAGRTLILNSATNTNNNILVAPGKTLTLATAGQLAGLAANGFQKTDEGTLVISADNSAKSGAMIVAGGILQLATNDGTGSGAITVNTRAQLNLSGGITEASALTISGVGPQNGGALQAVSGGLNIASGAITLGAASTIGATSGNTLRLTNAVAVNGAFALTVGNEGTVDFNGNIGNTVTALNTARTTNIAGPTVNINTAQTGFLAGSAITLAGGILNVGNSAGVGNLPASGTGLISATVGSTLNVTNATLNLNNRLGSTRPLTLQASNFNYTGLGSAASSEAVAALTIGAGQSTISITGGTAGNAATVTTSGLASNIVNVGGFLKLVGLDANNQLITTAAPTLIGSGSGGVIQRAALVNGANASLVTGAAATAISAATLSSVAASTDINNQAGAPAVFIATNNAQLAAGTHLIAGPNGTNGVTTTVNALVMDAGLATTLTGTASQILTNTSGNFLVAGNTVAVIGNSTTPNSSIVIGQGTVPSAFMVNTGSTLELDATITTGANIGLQKALAGTMEIKGKQFFSTGTSYFDINDGTVKLSAGDHTLAPQLVNIAVGPGATLDLNGTVLETNFLASSNTSATAGAGGTVTNTSATQATLIVRNGGNWGGQITGNVFVGRNQNATLSNDNTYTGATLITGATTTLTDLGKLSGTSAIDINGGVLTITNAGTINDNNRINDSAPITLRTGTINFTGRDNTASAETVGSVDVALGASQITLANNTNGTRSTVLTLSGLTHSNTDAAININGMSGDISTNARLLVTGGLPLANNIIGGWAVSGGAEFISYNSTYGVGTLGSTGMAGYDRNLAGTQTFTNLGAAENIKNTGTFASILGDVGGVGTAGNITLNTLVLNPGAASSLSFADSADTLYVGGNGMIRNGAFTTTIGSTLDSGRIAGGAVGASGLQTLHFHNTAAGTTVVNSRIVDNSATSATRLVLDLYIQAVVNLADGTTTSFQPAVTTTSGSAVVTTNSTAGLAVGQTISGAGIPAGATIISIVSPTQFAISSSATASGSVTSTVGSVGQVTLPSMTTTASTTVTLPAGNNTSGLYVGMPLNGPNFTPGTYVTAITGTTTFTINQNAIAATGISTAGVTNTTGNSYTGGTVVNGWTGNNGNSNAGTLIAGAVNAIPAGGLTINNALVVSQAPGSINPTNDVTMTMGAGLNLSGQTTLKSLNMQAIGYSGAGNGAPTVNIGAAAGSILTLTNPTITASSNNATSVGTNLITAGGASYLDFAGSTAVFNVDAIKENGVIIDPWTPTLNVATNVAIQNANGLTKSGNGVLQLSGQSTFTGGVNLNSGGLMIGGSTTASSRPDPTVAPVVTAGPLGVGSLTIAGGTRLLSSASANAIGNAVSVAGNFEFDGINNLALNGDVNLGGATRTISVNAPQMTATLGGVVSNGTITKEGYGTLILSNNNTMTGGVTVNNGTLVGQVPSGGNQIWSPFGAGAINYNGGVLSMRTSAGDATFGNDVVVGSSVSYANLDVQGGNTITMGKLTLPLNGSNNPLATQVNVSGSGGSTLIFPTTNLTLNGDGGVALSRVANQYQTFNVSNGVTTILMDTFCRNNEPLNIGSGSLVLGGVNCFNNATTITNGTSGAAPTANAATAIYGAGQTVTLSGGTTIAPLTYMILPQTNTVIGGNNTGGLQQYATNTASPVISNAAAWGAGFTSSYNGVLPNDAAFDRVLHTNSALSTLGVWNGYINITNAGPYEFLLGSDDYSSLMIDGKVVAQDVLAGQGVQDSARGSITLSAGQHTITYKINTGTGTAGGGGRLLYSGPDTALNGTSGNWQAISGASLSYFTGPANAGNNYYNAAQIDNDYTLAANSVFTFAADGTDYNSTVKSLTMGNASQLNATNEPGSITNTSTPGAANGTTTVPLTNTTGLAVGMLVSGTGITSSQYITAINPGVSITISANTSAAVPAGTTLTFTAPNAGGSGFIGVKGVTDVSAGGAILNPTSGSLYLIGGVNDGAAVGLTKQGNGTLQLNNSSAFTGAFNVQAGTVVLRETNALTTGTTTVSSGASVDLFGVGSSSGRNITLNGVGTASQIGALYNSQPGAATFAGAVNLASNTQISGFGDITISGAVSSAVGVTLTKIGANTLTLSANNTATLLGPITISGGVLNNGALNGGTGALGANTVTLQTTGLLNLNGNNISQALNVNGLGLNNAGPNANTFGSVINSSIGTSVATRNTVTAGNNMLELANTANTATISGNITLAGNTAFGSNTYATGGDIIISGIVSGANQFAKRGGDTVTLTGANTFTGGTFVDYGTVKLSGSGTLQGAGGFVTLQTGANFVIDDTSTVIQNRLNNATASAVAANNKALTMNGATFTIQGNNSTGVTETTLTGPTGDITGIRISGGQNYINLTNNGANVTLSTAGSGTGGALLASNGSTLLITGQNLGNGVAAATNTNVIFSATGTSAVLGQTGANGTANKGIIPWVIVDNTIAGTGTSTGISFATLDSASPTTVGLRPLASSEYATALPAPAPSVANLNVTSALTTASVGLQNTLLNSLTFSSTGNQTLTLAKGTTVNLQSGGILATQSATISGSGIFASDNGGSNNPSGTTFFVTTAGASTVLTIDASFGPTQANTGRVGELVKSGAGTLVLGGSNFDIANTRVNEGTLKINSNSAIYYRPANPANSYVTTGSNAGPALQVNAGGTVDMNGYNLNLNVLNSIINPSSPLGSLSGGVVTNTGTNKNLTINMTNADQTWAGKITGDINVARYGPNTFYMVNSNNYDGTTILGGGATRLVDLGALRNTSGVFINTAALRWQDDGAQADPWRLGAVPASVTLDGGGFLYQGRSGDASVANLGAVTITGGGSSFSTNAATLGSATVQMASFTRSSHATVNFSGSMLGDDGNVKVTSGVTTYKGIVGGWATTSTPNPYSTGGGDFVTYDPVSGFRAIVDYKTTAGFAYSGAPSTPAYGNTVFSAVSGAGENIRVNSNTTMVAGSNSANSMVIGSGATTTLAYGAATDTLFIQSGGVLGSTDNFVKNIGGATAPTATNVNGYLTAGNADGTAGAGNSGYELFVTNLSNVLTVNSQIVDNGANPVTTILSAGSVAGPVIRLNNSNTYTGPTIVQSADVRLNSLVGAPAIANSTDIQILGGNNAATDTSSQANNRLFFEASNQLNTGATVTIANGSANLDLNGFNQTLANLAFKNIGGGGGTGGMGPNVRTGLGTLTLTGGVTTSDIVNTNTIAAINGNMILTAGQHAFNISANTNAAQQIAFALAANTSGSGGIDKTGAGVFSISGINTYTGATNIKNGTLVLGGLREDSATDNAAYISNSRLTVDTGATVDLRGGLGFIGSLAGAGSVTNSVYAVQATNNNGNPATLTIGMDNSSGADFTGTFTNFINGANLATGFGLNVTKLGTGTQIISGNNALAQSSGNGNINNVGTLLINEGGVTVNGASGTLGFTAINLTAGGTLTLDDSVNNLANRLGGAALTGSSVITNAVQTSSTTITVPDATGLTVGMPIFGPGLNTTITGISGNVITTAASSQTVGAQNLTFYIGSPRTISMQGGTVAFNGGANLVNEGTASSNGIGNVTIANGNSVWSFTGAGGASVSANAFNASGGSLVLDATGSLLGQNAAGAGNVNVYVNGGMNVQGSGSISVGAPVNAVVGLQGGNLSGIGIRPDITGIDSTGTGLVTYDVYGFRLLTALEYNPFPNQPTSPKVLSPANTQNPNANWAAVSPTVGTADVRYAGTTYTGNILVDATHPANFTTNTTVASLRLDSGGGLFSQGGAIGSTFCPLPETFNPLGLLNTTTVTSGVIVGNSGNTGLTGGAVSAGGSALRPIVPTGATLDADTYLISTTGGIGLVKEGAGTLNLKKPTLLGSSTDAGQTVVNGGTLNLKGGPNTLTVLSGAGVALVDNLTINSGATVDLSGNTQSIGALVSADITPSGGGTLTNSGALANFYMDGNSTFGGSITGAINLFKTSTSTQNLTTASTYTGTTTIQGGILALQDSATLASTTYNIYGGQLRYENRANSLSGLANRTPSTATWNMRSASFMELGRPNQNIFDSVATVNLQQGYNEIRVDTSNAANNLNIATLNITAGAQAIFDTGASGTIGSTGLNPTISIGNYSAGTMAVNGVLPWAVLQSTADGNNINLATYVTTINPTTGLPQGVTAPASYAASNFNAATTGQNLNQTSTGTQTEVSSVTARSLNAIRFSSNAATTLALAPAELLRVEAGVIISAQQGLTFNNGRITSGVSTGTATNFYINPTNQAIQMNSQIVDNGVGLLTLVKGGGNTLGLTPSTATGLSATGAATTTTAGSTTVTLASAPTTPVAVGDPIQGPGIPNGATVTSVISTTSFTMSVPAYATTSSTTIGFGSAQVISGTSAAAASGAATPTTITVTNALANNLFAGATVGGTGMPAGITLTTIGAADSGGAGLTTLTISGGTATAAVAANQLFSFSSSSNVTTNSGYTGGTIVNAGTLTLSGAVGSRSLGGGSLTINSGAAVGMTNAGQIAPATDLTINGGGTLTFAPVTTASPATGGINALNSITFNNYGGTTQPKVDPGAAGILTVKSGQINAIGDNRGTVALVGGGAGAILNFGQVSLGTSGTNQITVADVAGFAVGQTIAGAGITGTTTITAINAATGTLTVAASTSGVTGAVYAVNQAPGGTTALAPTFNVTTTDVNELTPDLVVSAIITNSPGWTGLAGGGGALTKSGNGNLVLSGASTFDNGVKLTAGTLTIGAPSSGSPVVTAGPLGTGPLTISGGTTILSDSNRSVGNNVSVLGDFTFGGQQSGHNLTLAGAVDLGGALRTLTVTSPNVTATISGPLSGTAGLTKAGNGILTLSGNNNFTGPVTVGAGLLKAGSANALPSTSQIALTVKCGATFDVNGQNITIGSLTGDSSTKGGLVTSSTGTSTLTIGTDNTSTTFAGVITNAGTLGVTKVGSGTLTLTDINSYTGSTTINNGAITLNSTGQIYANMANQAPGGTIILNAGGTLNVDDSATNVANRLGGNIVPMTLAGGTLSVKGSGTAALTENLGPVTVNGGMSTVDLSPGAGGTNNLTMATYTYTSGTLFMKSTGVTGTNGLGLSAPGTGTANVTVVAGAPALTNGILPYGSGDDGTNKGFLTYDATKGFRIMTNAELIPLTQVVEPILPTQTGITSGLTSVIGDSSSNYVASTTINVTQDTNANTLTLASGGGLLINGGNLLTSAGALMDSTGHLFAADGTLAQVNIASGGIVAQSGNTGITNGAIATTGTNTNLILHTIGDLVLNTYELANGSGGIIKDGAGTLTLGKTDFTTGGLTINQGTVLLNSGAANTVVVSPTATVAAVSALNMNGGTLDLNGKDQAFAAISSIDTFTGMGGGITSTAAANLFTNSAAASTYSGVISGAVSLYKSGSNVVGITTLNAAQTYTGTTTVQGGGITLIDNGSVASTGDLSVNGGTLLLNNAGLYNNNNRIQDSAVVKLNGGTISLTGANAVSTTETLGTVNALQGLNTLTVTPPAATTLQDANLNITTLNRSPGASMVFTGAGLGSSLPGAAQIFATSIDPGTGTAAAPTNVNGILGSWATAGATAATADNWAISAGAQSLTATTTLGSSTVTLTSGDTTQMVVGQAVTGNANIPAGSTIATIVSATQFTLNTNATGTATATTSFGNSGIAPLNTVSGYTTLPTSSLLATTNYNTTAPTTTLVAGGASANSLRFDGGAAINQALDLGAGTVAITSGGIMRTSTGAAGTLAISNGTLTAGAAGVGGELNFVLNNTGAATVSAIIANNSGGTVSLVKSGISSLILTGNNSYTGATTVDSGTLTLSTASSNGNTTVSVPGDLVINNGGTVTETVAGTIKNTSNITLNGGATMTFTGTNTVNSLTFNDNGGTATPTVTTGTLTLASSTPITVTNDNYATTPVISGAALSFTGAAPVINVSGLSPEGLTISAPITGSVTTGITKTGSGTLVLNATNTYTSTVAATGFVLQDGGVIVNNTAAFGNGVNKVVIGNGSTSTPLSIMAVGTTTIANATIVNQDFTIGGTLAANQLTLSGAMDLAAGARTVTVTSPTVTGTISGAITNGTGLTKAGNGILVLSSTGNNYTGTTTVSGGLLKLGNAGVIPDASTLQVNSAGTFDIAGRAETVAALSGNDATHGGIITNSGATATLTVGNSTPTNTTFAGVIEQGTNQLNLAKTGSSVQTLTGANTYNGTTAISGTGGLIVNGSLANTAVSVASGSYLGGTGVIGVTNNAETVNTGGSVTVASGGAINLSTDNAIGTLTINANSGATALDMTSSTLTINTDTGATDQIVVGNNAKANLSTALTVNLAGLSGTTITPGVYNLITYSAGNGTGLLSTLGLNPAGITKGTDTSANGSASTTSFNTVATALQLIVGPSSNFYWNGSTDSAWNTNPSGPTNWSDITGATPTTTLPGVTDTVIFSSNTGANMATTLGQSFSINALQFGAGNNNTAGTTPATATIDVGSNVLTLNAGGIFQAPGTVTGSTISSSGSGSVNLLATQAWTDNASTNLTVSAPVTGTGGIVINGNGSGVVILGSSTANTYTGGTSVGGSPTPSTTSILQLAAGSTNALGATTNLLAVNGATASTGKGLVDLNGNSVTVGALNGTAGTSSTNNGSITSATAATLDVNTGSGVIGNYAGTIDGSVTLVKDGAGTENLILPASLPASTYAGGTTINAGILSLGNGTAGNENAGALGTGLVTVNSGGTLAFNAGAATPFTIANDFKIDGGTILNSSGAQHLGAANDTIEIAAGGATFRAAGPLIAAAANLANTNDLYIHGTLTGSGPITIANGVSRVHLEDNGTDNTYSGTLTNSGNLFIDAANVLANASVVNNSTGLQFGSNYTNAELAANLPAATFGSLAGSGGFVLSSVGGTTTGVALTVGGNNATTTFTGIIAGTAAGTNLIKTGTGTLNLNAGNTFGIAGGGLGVTVANGTVATNNPTGFGVGALALGTASSTGPVSALITGAVTVANPIVVTDESIAATSTPSIGSSGANGTFSGGITMNKDLTVSATLGNTTTISTAAITSNVAGTSILNATGPGNITITAPITGTSTAKVGLTVNEATISGVVTLNAAAGTTNYYGDTTITTGTLKSGVNNTMSINSAVSLSNSANALLDLSSTTAGNTQNIGSLSGGGTNGGNVLLGVANSVASIGALNTDATYGGIISGAGSLTKVGTGTETLTGVNTYTGATTVSGGTLQVGSGGVGSTAAGSTITATSTTFSTSTTGAGVDYQNTPVGGQKVVTGAPVVAGTGTIYGSTVIGASAASVGVLKPGDTGGTSNGTLNIGGNLTVNNGSQMQLGLTSTTQNDQTFMTALGTGATALTYLQAGNYSSLWSAPPTSGYDSIVVAGALNVGTGGSSTYPSIFVSDNGGTYNSGDVFKLLDWATVGTTNSLKGTGSFNLATDLVLPTLGAGLLWDTTAFTTYGVVVVVPEPGRVMLLLLGMMAMALRRRRREA